MLVAYQIQEIGIDPVMPLHTQLSYSFKLRANPFDFPSIERVIQW